jgi:hypothetical protein
LAAQAPATARTARGADACGEFGVAEGVAGGDLAEGLPDPLLEGRAHGGEGQGQGAAGRVDEGRNLGQGGAVRVGPGLGVGGEQAGGEGARVVAQADGAQPGGAAGDEQGAEAALADGVADVGGGHGGSPGGVEMQI